jgi:hypothetical protein
MEEKDGDINNDIDEAIMTAYPPSAYENFSLSFS